MTDDITTLIETEASRCLQCKTRPCSLQGCPLHNDIPGMIKAFREGDLAEAARLIRATSPLPAFCSRLCPHEEQCSGHCTRGIKGKSIDIGAIEAAVFDRAPLEQPVALHGAPVAVIGSGPAGLACARELLKAGVPVTIFERSTRFGGVPMLEIPAFRLAKDVVTKEISQIVLLGASLEGGKTAGRDFTWDDLKARGFTQAFWATGVLAPKRIGLTGEDLPNALDGGPFLESYNRGDETDQADLAGFTSAVIVGGGNVAMDCARAVRALGKRAVLVYRRSYEEMPAFPHEREEAKKDGVIFQMLTSPHAFDGKTFEGEIMELGDADASGRRKPVGTGQMIEIPADLLIKAVGNDPETLYRAFAEGITSCPKNYILTDGEGRTAANGIYAGGDVVHGAKTVVLAARAGKIAANAILKDRATSAFTWPSLPSSCAISK